MIYLLSNEDEMRNFGFVALSKDKGKIRRISSYLKADLFSFQGFI
jgi:hypothetical protein